MENKDEVLQDEGLDDDLDDIEEIDADDEEVEDKEEEVEGQGKDDGKAKDPKQEPNQQKHKQSAGERKAQAEARRKREEKARKEAEDKAYQKGVIQGLGGINPYTNEKIVDDIDYELYKEMKEAEEKGFDPTDTVELNKYRKTVKQEEAKQREAEEKSKLNMTNDIEEFQTTHKDVNIKELLADEKFAKFAEDMLGIMSLNKIYDKYTSFSKEAEEKAKEIALKSKARESASEGSLEGNGGEDLYTLDQIKKMSREEIDKNFDKVQRSMEKHYR